MKQKKLLCLIIFVMALFSCSKDDGPVQTQNSAPVINAQTFVAHEGITDNQAIGTVLASDTDKDDTLTFSIKTDNSNLFEITATGVLSLASGKKLDFTVAQTHTIQVSVSDGTESADAAIIINVTQNQSPIIADQSFSVAEDVSDTHEIGTVVATDAEEEMLVFSITNNDNDLFTISESGVLTLAVGQHLDFETATEHIITVRVSDGNTSADALVTITVENVIESMFEDPSSFITTWKTSNDNQSITIKGSAIYSYNFRIDWGDGTIEDIVNNNNGPDPSHVYATAGIHTVAIQGEFPAINMYGTPGASNLMSIEQWGEIAWKDMLGAFAECLNMEYNAKDVPNLSQVTSMQSMFYGATSFNGDLSGWNVSNVTNMSNMFYQASSFNGDISNWNVGNVSDMSAMFAGATVFNGNISNWNVSGVTNMSNMFAEAEAFNQDIGGWNVGNVSDMRGMFALAYSFNGDLSTWTVTKVTDMSDMFYGAISFNQNLSAWKVASVTDMSNMFDGATAFNGDISGWDVSKVEFMGFMFNNASSFNQDLSQWNVINVVNMVGMFQNANSFEGSIGGWKVDNVANMSSMFSGATSFDENVGAWNIGQVVFMNNMLENSGMSPPSYSDTLIGWAAQNPVNVLTLDAFGLKYLCVANDARDALLNLGWVINDDGLAELCP